MTYTPELRQEVKRRREAGETGAALSIELGIPLTTIYRWSTPGASEKHRKRNAEKYRTDPDHARKVRDRTRKQQYEKYHGDVDHRLRRLLKGLIIKAGERGHEPCSGTVEELKDAWTGQCHCCGEHELNLDRRLCIDHSHETGAFRGWLCQFCNKALGLCRDNPKILVEYLEGLDT